MSIILYKNSRFLCDWYRHLVPRHPFKRETVVIIPRSTSISPLNYSRISIYKTQESKKLNDINPGKLTNGKLSIWITEESSLFILSNIVLKKNAFKKQAANLDKNLQSIYIYISILFFKNISPHHFTSFPITNSFQNKNVINQPLELTLDRRKI